MAKRETLQMKNMQKLNCNIPLSIGWLEWPRYEGQISPFSVQTV